MDNNVRRKSRLSKNKKKAWRKVDITDVEEFLEDQRLQERTGGLVAEKTDDQLFVVDKNLPEKETEVIKKRRLREPKALKCYSHLVIDTSIKLPRKNSSIRGEKDRRPKHVIDKINSGIKTKKQLQAEEQRKKDRAVKQNRNRAKGSIQVATFDLWNDNGSSEMQNHRRVKRPVHKPASELSSVEVPHPGASYNPEFADYQDLLRTANSIEEKKLQKEIKEQKAEAKMPKVDAKILKETWFSEMSEGLDNTLIKEVSSDVEDDDRISVNPPVRRESKKTKTQRNKEKRKKLQEKLKAQEKLDKSKASEIFRLKSIKSQIKEKEKDLKERAEKRKERWKEQGKKTRKLGRLRFEEPLLEVKLSDDLEGSLRLLKPEGNLFVDRMKSLEKRNILEPRKEANKYRKYKRKTVIKRSHKSIT